MKTGKIPENVLKRSVLKNITGRQQSLLQGAGVGRDSSMLKVAEEQTCLLTGSPYIVRVPGTEELALYGVINNFAASRAETVAVWMNVLLPPGTEEKQLKQLMRRMDDACNKCGIMLAGGHTEVTQAVSSVVISLTGLGRPKKDRAADEKRIEAGLDLVMTKWIGLEGTYLLVKHEKQQLEKHLPKRFLEEAECFGEWISVEKEAEIASRHGACCMHDASNGGIFGALWELGERCNIGLEIDLRSIPARQETIEICEQLQLNPYLLDARGSMLIVSPQGHHLVRALQQEGIVAAVIGQTTDSHDRVLLNEEERRYLELPRQDELHKII